MKTVNRYIFSGVVAVALLGQMGCKKSFLEIEPKAKLVAKNTNDYDLLLNNLDLLNTNTDAQVPMGDEVAAINPYFSGSSLRTQRLFRWDDVVYEPTENNSEMTVPMTQIYLYNKVINEVPAAVGGTEEKKKSLIAEARAGRAWCYFMLINYFGKQYNDATSAADEGYPIITEADVTQTAFKRASVKEVYDFIVEDLKAAIPDLPQRITWRLRMSKMAAEGLLGKVYVFMRKYDEALPLLNSSINGISNSDIPVGFYDYNVTFGTGGSFLPISLFGPTAPTAPNHQEVLFAKNFSNSWTLVGNEIIISQSTKDKYDAADLRLNLFSNLPYGGTAYAVPGGMRRVGAPGSVTPYGVYLPDLLLLRAECKARANDLDGATSDLEFLRTRRMSANASIPAGMDKEQMVRYIINEERVREFAVLGYRWFDMRRMSVDPIFAGTTFTHTLYNADGTVKETYTLRPERLVLRFGQKLMDANPGMNNNQ